MSTLRETVRRLARLQHNRPAVESDVFAEALVAVFYDDNGYGSIARVWPLIQAAWPDARERRPHLWERGRIGRFMWGLTTSPSPGGNALDRLVRLLEASERDRTQPRRKPEATP